MEAIHPSQGLGHPSFFYYTPEFNADQRQHGHFSPHPSAAQDDVQFQQQGYQQDIMNGQSQKVFARRLSTSSSIYLQSQPQHMEANFTPMASPRPLHQRPSFLGSQDGLHLSLDTESITPDLHLYPSTPPLSVSGSSVSSPPSTCSVLPTPVSGPFFNMLENLEGVKEGCVGDVTNQILAGGDWSRTCSPPLTPGKPHTPHYMIAIVIRIASTHIGSKTKKLPHFQKYVVLALV